MANVSSSNGLEKRPKLRFPGFDEPWKKCEFKEFAEVNPKCQSIPEQFYYIDLGSVEDGELSNAKIENALSAPSRAQRLLSCNDVLFQTVRPYQQNNYLFCEERSLPTVASTGYAVFRTEYDVPFLYALIHTGHFLNSVLSRCTGTSFPAVSASDIEDILVSIPSLGEQQKIGELFGLLNSKIRKQKALIESLKKYKRGLLHKVFLQSRRSNWGRKCLQEIASFTGGGTPSKDVASYWNGTIAWISSSDLQEDWIDTISITRRITTDAIENSATKICPKGSIAIVSRVGVGKVAIMPEELCTSQDFINVTAIAGNTRFMAYQIAYKMKVEAARTQGTSIKGITTDTIKSLEVDIPSDEEQEYLARMLSAFDSILHCEIHQLDALVKQRRALLQQIFT